jgi:uncharacterized protein YeaO (DUF488 family)
MGVISPARVRDAVETGGRPSFLVERLWPRGIRRAALSGSQRVPDVDPSRELRKWFGHDRDNRDEFRRRCFGELDGHPEVWRPRPRSRATSRGSTARATPPTTTRSR